MNRYLTPLFFSIFICLCQSVFAMSDTPDAGAVSSSDGHVCFWQDKFYQGNKFCYSSDISMLPSSANDQFSSMKMYNGYYAEVFKHGNYSGNRSIIMIDTPVLDYLKDDISSLKVKRRNSDDYACLHENKYFSGTPYCLEAGQQSDNLSGYNDKASGLTIYGNVEAIVWADGGFKSSKEHLLFSEAKLENTDLKGGVDWQDKISSFKVSRISNLADLVESRDWCSRDEHCNVGGQCLSGKCQCAGGMSGLNCDKLDLKPSRNSSVYEDTTNSYWGGSPVLGDDGRFHIFSSRFTNSCGLNTWLANSECVRASSSSPTGPFVTEDVVQGVFCHNPTVRKAPDGSFLMFYIGDDKSAEKTHCANGQSFEPGPSGLQVDNCEIRVKRATSITGPWSDNHKISSAALNGICPTNPAPVIEDDGKIKLYYRDYDLLAAINPSYYDYSERPAVPERMYLLKANKWNGIYTQQQPNPILAEYSEDGFAWQGEGGYHMVFNNKFSHEFFKGGYASSKDGVNWNVRSSVYTREVPYANGEVKQQRRERPQILWLDQSQGKGVLMNGVQVGPGDKTATLAFKIGDWDQFFALKDARSQRCLDISGDDNQVTVGANVQLWDCQNEAQDQQWFYDFDAGSIKNKANQALCLQVTNTQSNGGNLQLASCDSAANQQFDFDGNIIRLRNNNNLVIDSFGDKNGENIGTWGFHGKSNQRWSRLY